MNSPKGVEKQVAFGEDDEEENWYDENGRHPRSVHVYEENLGLKEKRIVAIQLVVHFLIFITWMRAMLRYVKKESRSFVMVLG